MTFSNQITIDLSAIQANFRALCGFRASTTPVPVIKSDAYGHDAPAVARALEAAGARILAVFTTDEALELRAGGYSGAIWLLEGALPSDEELEKFTRADATSAAGNMEQLQALEAYGAKHDRIFNIHLKIDTGMSRLGFMPSDVRRLAAWIGTTCPHLNLKGAFSHIATADQPDSPLTQNQVALFREAMKQLPDSCSERHLCATEAFLNGLAPELPYARPGIGIYGYCAPDGCRLSLTPAMTFTSHVISVKTLPAGAHVSYGATYTLEKETRLAVIAAGYADGYLRAFGNRASVVLRGVRVPIRGRVCMGMFMVDVTSLPDVAIGDEAVLLGRQGSAAVTADELASIAGTIPYEILCQLGKCPNRITAFSDK